MSNADIYGCWQRPLCVICNEPIRTGEEFHANGEGYRHTHHSKDQHRPHYPKVGHIRPKAVNPITTRGTYREGNKDYRIH